MHSVSVAAIHVGARVRADTASAAVPLPRRAGTFRHGYGTIDYNTIAAMTNPHSFNIWNKLSFVFPF